MDTLKEFKELVGAEKMEQLLKRAAIEAVKNGKWSQVKAIADFVCRDLNGHQLSSTSRVIENRLQMRNNSKSHELENSFND